jgi:protein SCO1/2
MHDMKPRSVAASATRLENHRALGMRARTRAFAIAVALLCGSVIVGCKSEAPSFKSTDVTGADYGKQLTLTNVGTGKATSLDDFRGKLLLVFFGFTHCPDICPTTLAKAAQVKKELGSQGDKLQVLFVTVDPERDTPEVLSRYVPAFDGSFIGLRGDPDETAKAAREFKVFFQKVPNRDGTSYNVDHTAASYVLDTQGRLRLFVRHTQPVEEIVADIKQLL